MSESAPPPAFACPTRHGLPHPILTRPRWRKAGMILFAIAMTTNFAAGLAGLLPEGIAYNVHAGGWALTALVFGASLTCTYRSYAAWEPRRAKLTYRDGTSVRVRFRRDPDRASGTYRAYRRTGRWPWTPWAPYDRDDGLTEIHVADVTLSHALRIGDTVIPIALLAACGLPDDPHGSP